MDNKLSIEVIPLGGLDQQTNPERKQVPYLKAMWDQNIRTPHPVQNVGPNCKLSIEVISLGGLYQQKNSEE